MNNPGKSGAGYPGQSGVSTPNSRFNQTWFIVEQLLALVRTATIVQVVNCTNSGGISPVGFVNVTPLVNMMDGLGNTFPHGTVCNLPYARIQGGASAIICDPQVGDLGVAVFADRDISTVKNTKKRSNPGSRRRYHFSDGIYLFGLLNAAPQQYVRFYTGGMEFIDVNGNKIQMTSTGTEISDDNGNVINMVSAGIQLNGVLIDRSQNVSGIVQLTTSGQTNLGGGSQAVKLADGSNATKVKAT